jgi:hypothetical protein
VEYHNHHRLPIFYLPTGDTTKSAPVDVILELFYHRVMILQVVLGVENHSVLLDDDEYEIISLLAMMFWEVSPLGSGLL